MNNLNLKDFENLNDREILIALVLEFQNVKKDVKEIKNEFENAKKTFVTRMEFLPVRAIAYASIGALFFLCIFLLKIQFFSNE